MKTKEQKRSVGKWTPSNILFNILNYAFLTFLTIICLYPMLHVLFASVSNPTELIAHQGLLLKPIGFTLSGYQLVFKDNSILIGFRNTFVYVGLGTLLNMAFTIMGAYTLSRKGLLLKRPIMIFITITMFFGGGLIPTYLVIRNLHMLNTMWALVLPGCLSVYNMIVARTFFKSNISEELYEAAEIDGCTQGQFFFRIALPLSAAITAILVLYYGVGHWNSYFSALVYISDSEKYPLQLVLRNILITNETALAQTATTEAARAALREKQQLIDVMKYSLIIISSIPVLLLYPFIQKYFVKGVMIGSLKG